MSNETRDWKPGDLALVRYDGDSHWVLAIRTTPPSGWRTMERGHARSGPGGIVEACPVAWLDPEDAGDTDKMMTPDLRRAFECILRHSINDAEWERMQEKVQDALREFAKPEPPKPAEPTSPAARVIDRDGDEWARNRNGMWKCLTAKPRSWVAGQEYRWNVLLKDFGPVRVIEP